MESEQAENLTLLTYKRFLRRLLWLAGRLPPLAFLTLRPVLDISALRGSIQTAISASRSRSELFGGDGDDTRMQPKTNPSEGKWGQIVLDCEPCKEPGH